jgi:hypothetical protein
MKLSKHKPVYGTSVNNIYTIYTFFYQSKTKYFRRGHFHIFSKSREKKKEGFELYSPALGFWKNPKVGKTKFSKRFSIIRSICSDQTNAPKLLSIL